METKFCLTFFEKNICLSNETMFNKTGRKSVKSERKNLNKNWGKHLLFKHEDFDKVVATNIWQK